MHELVMGLCYTLGLAYIVYLDAKALKNKNELLYAQTIRMKPTLWAILSFLLFIAFAPVYFLRRNKFRTIEKDFTASWDESEAGSNARLFLEASGIVILWAVIFAFMQIIIYILNLKPSQLIVLGALPLVVMAVLIDVCARRHQPKAFWNMIGFSRAGKPVFLLIVLPAIIGLCLGIAASLIQINRKTIPMTPFGQVISESSFLGVMFFLGLAILIAPLLEEMIFRGYFFSVIRKFKGKLFSVGLISIIFVIFHIEQYWGDWLGILIIACLGFCLTSLRAGIGSVIPSIIVHYSYNFLVIVIPICSFFFSYPAFSKFIALHETLDEPAKEQLLLETIDRHPEFVNCSSQIIIIPEIYIVNQNRH